jgi:hypothetical protein
LVKSKNSAVTITIVTMKSVVDIEPSIPFAGLAPRSTRIRR